MLSPRLLCLFPILALVGGPAILSAATPATPMTAASSAAPVATLPTPATILAKAQLVNNQFMAKWPDTGATITVKGTTRPSNIWTRGVYYEGLMALQGVAPEPKNLAYAVQWSEAHKWSLRNGLTGDADDQDCGQTYLELYQLDPQPVRLTAIKARLDAMVASAKVDDWTWIDALQMSMPAFAKLGVITHDPKYFEKMHALYLSARDQQGFYNPAEGLWWRDKNFVFPTFKEPNGQSCYWSRGNGWVMVAMMRVLDVLPADAPYRGEYVKMLQDMAAAVKKVQRTDGFWNPSLHDAENFGGKETSGTALFTAAIAWGINHQILSKEEYLPVVARAWNALATEAVHPDGFLGFVQGTGKQPSEGQPVTYDHAPDFEDYGVGCFLLAASETSKLAGGAAPKPAPASPAAR